MRFALSTTLLLALAACDTGDSTVIVDDGGWWGGDAPAVGDGPISYRSTFPADLTGVYLPGEGRDYGVGTMYGMTCQVYLDTASTGLDVDLDGGDDAEEIEDGGEADGGGVIVLVNGNTDVYTLTVPDGRIESLGTGAVVAGALWENGTVVLRDDAGCRVQWMNSGVQRDVAVSGGFCADGGTIEPMDRGDSVFVGGRDGLVHIGGDGAVTAYEDRADLMAWDDSIGVLYAAIEGRAEVFGLDTNGNRLWTQSFTGPVRGLEQLGGYAVVSVGESAEESHVVMLDGLTGEVESEQAVRRAAGRLHSSADGTQLSLSNPWTTDFFDVAW